MNNKVIILSIILPLILFTNLIAQELTKEINTRDSYKNSYLKFNLEIPSGWVSITPKEEFENIKLDDERLNIGAYNSSAIIELRKDKEKIIPSIRIFVKSLSEESKKKFSKLTSTDLVKAISPMSSQATKIHSVNLKNNTVGYVMSESEETKHIVGIILSSDFLYQIYITYDKNDPNCTEQKLELIFKSFDIE
jgi:hypothetical protein